MYAPITTDELARAMWEMHDGLPKFGLDQDSLPRVTRVYQDALGTYDREVVFGAGKMVRRTLDKFPTPHQWREACQTWLKHNRPIPDWKPEEDAAGNSIVCGECRSIARWAVLRREDGSEFQRMIAPCDAERHHSKRGLTPFPENFMAWVE